MDWLKDASPAALMLIGLIYVVRYFGNHLSTLAQTINNLVAATHELIGMVDACEHRRGADDERP